MSSDWKAQEKRVAKATGGSRNAGSGAFSRKGDVRSGDVHWELKWTGKKSFSLKADMLEENMREAYIEGRVPVFGLELNGRNYVVMEENDFLEMWQSSVP